MDADQLRVEATKALAKLGFKPDPSWCFTDWAMEAKSHLNRRKKKTVVTADVRMPREVARQILLFFGANRKKRVMAGVKRRRW